MGINAGGVVLIGLISDYIQRHYLLALVYLVRGVAFVSLIVLPGATAMWAFALIGGASWPRHSAADYRTHRRCLRSPQRGYVRRSDQLLAPDGWRCRGAPVRIDFRPAGHVRPRVRRRRAVSAGRWSGDPDNQREEVLSQVRPCRKRGELEQSGQRR